MTSLAQLVTRALLVLGLLGLSHATILSSAQDGDEAAVLQYLQDGNDPDVMSDKNRTMLMFAAIEGHANIITILLQYNASLDLVDANGRTAVMFAARSGHSQVVDLLISGGASLDIQDKDLRTALILAAMANQTDTVRALLQGGADADIMDFKDLKAINHAARRDRVDIVCLLKDYTTLSPSYAFGGVAGKCFLNGTVYFVGNETFNGVELVRCVDTCVWETNETTTTSTTPTPTPTPTSIRTTSTTQNATVIPDRLFCAAECGRANLTVPRIVGGQVATRLEYPWVAYITISGGGGQDVSCGGAIVNRDHVITAAHCFSDRDTATSTITVFLAEHDLDDLTETNVISIFVQELFVHPDYKADGRDTEEHDIALLYLGGTLNFGVGVQPICISTPDDFAAGQEVVIVGWGLTDFANKSSSSNLLREVTVTTIDLDQCITLYQNAAQRQFVNENMICTLTAGKDACSGDSGGPVIAQVDGVWVLLGIVSFGNGCADITAPGVHTNVANYVDWMIESIGGSFC